MKEVNIISKVVSRDGTGSPVSGGKATSVDLSAYLLKQIWEKAFEIKTTEDGTEYLFAKLNVATQYGITMYADGAELDLPSIYDGIPFDNKTIWLNEETGVVEVIGTGGSVEYALTWSGFSIGSYDGKSAQNIEIPNNTNQLTNGAGFITSSALSGYATETWVGENFLPITGGQLQGDLRLRAGSEYYGRTLYFGDGSYAYISEDSDDHMLIYGDKGVDIEIGTSYYLGVTGKGIKLNGGILTYNSSSGYWELEGDLLVNGDITMI